MKSGFSLLLVGLFAAPLCAAGPTWTAKEMASSGRRWQKGVAQGRIEKAFNLDFFVMKDETGEILLNAADVRHSLAAGDEIVVYGRYFGRSDQYGARPEFEAIEIAKTGTPDADKILLKSSRAADKSSEPAPSPIPISIETRLRTLDDLKAKGLISDSEFQEARKRILSEL